MSMTRQHFQAIADAIKEARTAGDTPAERQAIDAVALEVAIACKRFNSGFKRDRFLEACGVRVDGPVSTPLRFVDLGENDPTYEVRDVTGQVLSSDDNYYNQAFPKDVAEQMVRVWNNAIEQGLFDALNR